MPISVPEEGTWYNIDFTCILVFRYNIYITYSYTSVNITDLYDKELDNYRDSNVPL